MKRIQLYIGASILLAGCGVGDEVTSGKVENKLSGFSFAKSKLGASGGFVDVDGDGKQDVVLGAPSANKASGLGVALVYKQGASLHTITSANPEPSTGDNSFGASFANLGDVDGDGKQDYAIGAIYGNGDNVSMSGAVYVYKGGSNGQLIKKLSGEMPMDRFGMTLATGDFNNDGKNDIVVGAPFNSASPALYQTGSVYVYFGPDFTKSVAIKSTSSSKSLGWSAAVGDINKDDVADLLVGASGKVLGFYGAKGSFAPAIGAPDLTIISGASDFGKAIAVMSDVDGDGFSDIAIGAPKATVGTNRDTGMLFFVKGGAGTRTVDLTAATVPDLIAQINGANLFDRFGSSIVAMHAGDGDNLLDLVVAAPWADAVNGTETTVVAGKVYVFPGKKIGAATTLADASVLQGATKFQGFGTWLAAGPEHHLLVGMPMAHAYNGDAALVPLVPGHEMTSFTSNGLIGSAGGGDSSNGHGGSGGSNAEHDH